MTPASGLRQGSVPPGSRALAGPPLRSRLAPAGAAVAVILLALLLALAPGGLAPASAAPGDGGLRVEITGISPAVPVPDQPLTVSGAVHNDSDTEVSGVYVNLRLQRNAPTSRRVLDLWLDTGVAFATRSLAERMVEEPLPAGATIPFTFTVAAGGLGLGEDADAWGPRGLSVNVSGTAEGGQSPGAWLTDSTRSLVVWLPGEPTTTTTTSVLLPLVPTAAELAQAQATGVSVAAAGAGRIGALVAASADVPQVAWALDPLLLRPPPAPEQPVPDDDAAPPAAPPAPAPEPDLVTAAAGREVISLPYADADAAALVRQGEARLLDAALSTGAGLLDAAGVRPLSGIGWPAAEGLDEATLTSYSTRGVESVILPGESLPVTGLAYTPTGRGSVAIGERSLEALLWDEDLSAALSGSVPALEAEDLGAVAGAVAARQYVLGVSALVGLERPAEPRHLLLALDRAAAGGPNGLRERLTALAGAPWVRLAPVSELLAAPAPDLDRSDLVESRPAEGEVSAAELAAVVSGRTELAQFGAVASDPASLVGPTDGRLLQVTSTAWRAEPQSRRPFLAAARLEVAALQAGIGVEASGTVNLISSSGDLPVTVRNDLDQAVNVTIRLTPQDPSLQVTEEVEYVAPPRSAQPVPVAVKAVGNADVQILAELVTPSGDRVGTPATWTVRVRADWESVGTAAVAGALALLFVVGLVRNIRRGRRRGDANLPARAAAAAPAPTSATGTETGATTETGSATGSTTETNGTTSTTTSTTTTTAGPVPAPHAARATEGSVPEETHP